MILSSLSTDNTDIFNNSFNHYLIKVEMKKILTLYPKQPTQLEKIIWGLGTH